MRVFEGASLLWILALVLALLAPGVAAFYVVFAVMGFGTSGATIGDLSIAMEFGPAEERPTSIGLARTAMGPPALITPVVAGAILMETSFPVLLLTSLGFALAGLLVLWRRVKEPRHLTRQLGLPR